MARETPGKDNKKGFDKFESVREFLPAKPNKSRKSVTIYLPPIRMDGSYKVNGELKSDARIIV